MTSLRDHSTASALAALLLAGCGNSTASSIADASSADASVEARDAAAAGGKRSQGGQPGRTEQPGRGGSSVGGSTSQPLSQRPHVIVMMTDDQGYGDVGYYGHPDLRTSELDKMAANGIRFDRYYAADSVCSPSRGGMLTGRHPSRFRCYGYGYDMPTAEITLAEVLRDAGYATSHFGKWHLGGLGGEATRTNRGNLADAQGGPVSERAPGGQGFDHFYSAFNFYDLGFNSMNENGVERALPPGVDTSVDLVDKAIAHFDQLLTGNKPIFSMLWFPSPHKPHEALASDKEAFAGHDPALQDYYGELTGIDRAVGKLRTYLRAQGIESNTQLWFTSDNGPTPVGSSGGLRGGKLSLFEGGIRVPGILEWPGVARAGRQVTTPVAAFDLFPTVLGLLGIPLPEREYDGTNLMPLIREEPFQRPPLFFAVTLDDHTPGDTVIMDGRYKLKLTDAGNRASRTPPFESYLFDLEADPAEESNLFNQLPDEVSRLTKALRTWRASVEADVQAYVD